jgi:N-glycosylase/DNA lyase
MRLDVPFDLNFSLCCGQVFRWKKLGDWWYGVVGENVLKITQFDNNLEFEGVNEDFVRNYFGLNDDLDQINHCIAKDPHIRKALKRFEGLRLVRQEPWACLIGFICSIYKNIAAIEQMLQRLSEKYGEKRRFDCLDLYLFPTVDKLANASEAELRECGLGFRAKYVLATAKKIRDENLNFQNLKVLPYLEARKKLLYCPGVGLKVADCVLLFSLNKMEAFPVDVWVKRVILIRFDKQNAKPQLPNQRRIHKNRRVRQKLFWSLCWIRPRISLPF